MSNGAWYITIGESSAGVGDGLVLGASANTLPINWNLLYKPINLPNGEQRGKEFTLEATVFYSTTSIADLFTEWDNAASALRGAVNVRLYDETDTLRQELLSTNHVHGPVVEFYNPQKGPAGAWNNFLQVDMRIIARIGTGASYSKVLNYDTEESQEIDGQKTVTGYRITAEGDISDAESMVRDELESYLQQGFKCLILIARQAGRVTGSATKVEPSGGGGGGGGGWTMRISISVIGGEHPEIPVQITGGGNPIIITGRKTAVVTTITCEGQGTSENAAHLAADKAARIAGLSETTESMTWDGSTFTATRTKTYISNTYKQSLEIMQGMRQ